MAAVRVQSVAATRELPEEKQVAPLNWGLLAALALCAEFWVVLVAVILYVVR
jgi:hypothetical protein